MNRKKEGEMKNKPGFLKRMLVVLAAVSLIIGMLPTAVFAAGANAAVQNDTTGVLQIMVGLTDTEGREHSIQAGTGFLINDNTIVTCDHVIEFGSEVYQWAADNLGLSEKQVNQNRVIHISVVRDVTIKASVQKTSAEVDLAVLTLEQPINGRTILPIRSSKDVSATEACFALGFPGIVSSYDNINTFTSDDVTISNGTVNKVNSVNINGAAVDYVINSAKIDSGNSGGPLVDEDGSVIGIAKATLSADGFDEDYYYAVSTDHLTDILDPLGISYTRAGTGSSPAIAADPTAAPAEPTPEPVVVDKTALQNAISNAEKVDVTKFTDETAAKFDDALTAARTMASKSDATESEVMEAASALAKAQESLAEKSSGLPLPAIIGIIAAIAVVIILIIVLMTKKKKPAADAGAAFVGATPNYGPTGGENVIPNTPAQPTGVLDAGMSETTILNAGANETTVLGGNTYGTLTRKKTFETITITKPAFAIGREQNKVDYCIKDNGAVGRRHAEIVSRGGETFIVDRNSTNGTFVNDVRVSAGVETKLNSGDTISLADEEFTYNA